MQRSPWLTELGIPQTYGVEPPLPTYNEAAQLEEVEPSILGQVERLWPRTARDWRRMKAAAAADGVQILLVSGFRSFAHQAGIIRAKLARGEAIDAILKVNAAPGFSQHHTGRAVDIATPGTRPLTVEFDRSEAFAWLSRRAAAFGFRMPYGRDNAYGLTYEPWHWCQLGAEARPTPGRDSNGSR